MLLRTGLEATWLATQCSTEANLVIHGTLCTCSVGGLPCCGSCVRPTSMCSGSGFALTSVFKLEKPSTNRVKGAVRSVLGSLCR